MIKAGMFKRDMIARRQRICAIFFSVKITQKRDCEFAFKYECNLIGIRRCLSTGSEIKYNNTV